MFTCTIYSLPVSRRTPLCPDSRGFVAQQRNDGLCHNLTFRGPRDHKHLHCASSSSKNLACFKSNVSKPSVNHP